MTTPWTPAEIQTELWLDAADASTLTLVSGAVSEWRDKSGNLYHVSQGTAANRPARVAAGRNGLDVVRFDGSNDYLVRTAATNLFRNVSEAHVFIVRKFSAVPTTLKVITGISANVSTQIRMYDSVGLTSQKERAFVRRIDGSSGAFTDAKSSIGTAWGIQGFSASFSASLLTYWNNGSADGSVTIPGTGNTSDTASTKLAVGSSSTEDTANTFGGDIAEIVYCHTLAAGVREKIEGYLAHKWGLEYALPVGHLYKNSPPIVGALVAVNGKATTQAGNAAGIVSLHDHATKALVATATPATNGDWTASVEPGTYDISYWADGCRPVTHGPYTVEPE